MSDPPARKDPPRRHTVSVIICAYTHDRWDDLLAAVASVRAQSLPPSELIVVVDHNPALQTRLKAALPDVVVVANRHKPGLSGSKNTGVALARGELVAFLDDDAVAEPGWLHFLNAGYTTDTVMGVGGLTRPLWETQRPAWFPEEFDWVIGCSFVGRKPGPVRNLLGGNASFRREVFPLIGGFSCHIGRRAGNRRPLGGEETELCIRLSKLCPEATFIFDPQAVIWHRVPAARARFSYFRSRCYAEGLSKALITRSVGAAAGLSAERHYAAVTLRRGITQGLLGALRGQPAGLARSMTIIVGLLCTGTGYAAGVLHGRRATLPRWHPPEGSR
jgi:glycosyltransferase involved in cell wall biosynthesis